MSKETLKEKAAREAQEGRDLVLLALDQEGEYLTPAEIGEMIGVTGYQAGQFLRVLVREGKVKRAGTGAGKYLYTKVSGVAVPKKAQCEITPKLGDRWLIAWMIDGKGFGQVVTTKEAARSKAKEISKELPGHVVFYGKATGRFDNTITETSM